MPSRLEMLVCPSWFLILFKWAQIYIKLSFFLHFYVEKVFE